MMYLLVFICFMQLFVTCLIYKLVHEQARRWSIWLEYLRDREIRDLIGRYNSYDGHQYLDQKTKVHLLERLERI